MEHELRLTIFWILHLVMLGLFGVELLVVLAVWFKARVPGLPPHASRLRKVLASVGGLLRLIFSRRIWVLLKALVQDGMVHRRLYSRDKRRWAIHIAVFGSWLVLGILSTITGVVVEFLPLFGMESEQIGALPLIGGMFHADVWWVALLNDILGLTVLAGMLLVVYRRYIKKDSQLRTMPADTFIIVLLTIVAFSGYPTEVFRLLADYTTPAGVLNFDPAMISLERLPEVLHSQFGPEWAFIGYPSALVLGNLGFAAPTWEILHNVFFWLHFVVVTILLYCLPFSRFFHVIMSPVIVAYNTMRKEEVHGHGGVKQPIHGAVG